LILDWPKWLGTAAAAEEAVAEDTVVDEADEVDEVGGAAVDSLHPTQHHWDEAAGDFSICWEFPCFFSLILISFQRPLFSQPRDTR
jgi:hypothetical protein